MPISLLIALLEHLIPELRRIMVKHLGSNAKAAHDTQRDVAKGGAAQTKLADRQAGLAHGVALVGLHRPSCSGFIFGIRHAAQQLFDLSDQKGQVRLRETQLRRWNTVMFDVGWDMFMVIKSS
jgi:hypothetical protein